MSIAERLWANGGLGKGGIRRGRTLESKGKTATLGISPEVIRRKLPRKWCIWPSKRLDAQITNRYAA
jgi:hypothetical protein